MVEPSARFDGIGSGFAHFFQPPPADVIRFTIGEPDMETPGPIKDIAIQDIKTGMTHYSRARGLERTCKAVASYLGPQGIEASWKNVIITSGAKQALLSAFLACCDPGTNVIVPAPAWPSYDPQIRFSGLIPIHVPVNNSSLHLDLEAIKEACNEKTSAIVVNSPNNPTGAVYSREEMESLVCLAEKRDLWIISDEIYAPMIWTKEGHISPASLPRGKGRTMVIGGWSKGWAMTGWRLGWIFGPSDAMDAVAKVQANSITHAPTFLQGAAALALEDESLNQEIIEAFSARRELVQSHLKRLKKIHAPSLEGAFYAFMNIEETGMDSIEFCRRALEEARVQLIPGGLMEHGEGWVRLSYATNEEKIREGLSKLEEWLENISLE